MVYLLLNCDEYLATQQVARLKAALGEPEMADLNTTEVAGSKTDAADLLGQASMMPFLSARRLVIVDGYLSQLDKRMAASKGTDSAAYVEAAHFLEGMTGLPEFADLVLIEAAVDKRRHLWRGFSMPGADNGQERKIPGLGELAHNNAVRVVTEETPDPRQLSGWIQKQVKAKGIAIEGRAIQQLAAYVGPNLRQLDNELDKLATYAADRAVTAADVSLLVSDASEAMIWTLTDALAQRNPGAAMRSLQALRRGDANAFYLLTMIARQYRIVLKVKDAMTAFDGRSGNEYDIAKIVGEKPYPVKMAMQLSTKYSFDELMAILDRLLEADVAMKTGADAETEIDVLIAELTQKRRR